MTQLIGVARLRVELTTPTPIREHRSLWNVCVCCLALAVLTTCSPTKPDDIAAIITSVQYVRTRPVTNDAAPAPSLFIARRILGDSLNRTTETFCLLRPMNTTTFVCDHPLSRAIPLEQETRAWVFDDAVGRRGSGIARDIYINGELLRRVTVDSGGAEIALFIIRRDGHVE
jgi:hypothetical protein